MKQKNNNTFCHLNITIFFFIIITFVIPLFLSFRRKTNVDYYPVDVVYKYIDLTDKRIAREGFKQTEKDYDNNNELIFSLRSVFMNMPWVRKIFIIMPNEDLPFIDNSDKRKKKIVYIKDKDLLGFDSSSPTTFEENGLWQLGRFGVSKGFIYMNDDYFIGKKVKKSDFFYYSKKEKRIVPYVMARGVKLSSDSFNRVEQFYNDYSYLLNGTGGHSSEEYILQVINGYRLLYKMLNNKNISLPKNIKYSWHNAVPFNLQDLREIHDIIEKNYEYAYECFNAKYRNNKQMILLTFYSFYYLNKYERNISDLKGRYTRIESIKPKQKINEGVFCINTGNLTVTKEKYRDEKQFLNKKFGKKFPFEKR